MANNKFKHLLTMRDFVTEYMHECRDKKRALTLNVVRPNTFGSQIRIQVKDGVATMSFIDGKRKSYITTMPIDVNVANIDLEGGFKKTVHAKVFDTILDQVTSVIDDSLEDGLMFIDHDRQKIRPLVDKWMGYIGMHINHV